MKYFFIFASLLISFTKTYALYFGNPAEPQLIDEGLYLNKEIWTSVKVGYQGDYTFDRRLKAYRGAKGRIDRYQSLMNQGVLTINFGDRVDIYGSVGAMSADVIHRPHFDMKQREYQSNDHVTWGGGAKMILFRWGDVCLSGDIKYQSSHPRIKWITLNGTAYTTNAELKLNEWQAGAGVSRHIDIFTPYLAIAYSKILSRMQQIRPVILNHSHFKMEVRNPIVLAIGCSLSTTKILDLTVEWRMISEEAVTWSGNVKF